MFGEVQKHWPLDFKQDAVDAPQGVFVRDVFFLNLWKCRAKWG